MANRYTTAEWASKKKRAFQIFCKDPTIKSTVLAREVGVSCETIYDWKKRPEWIEWTDKYFASVNDNLKQRICELDDKIINYIEDLISGNLEPDQIKASNAVVNVYKTRLEMAGLINKKSDTINNNYIDKREVKSVHIENMDENQLLKFITSNEVPKDLDKIENSLIENKKISDQYSDEIIVEEESENFLNLEALGIKTV